jgi:hypothetical protein
LVVWWSFVQIAQQYGDEEHTSLWLDIGVPLSAILISAGFFFLPKLFKIEHFRKGLRHCLFVMKKELSPKRIRAARCPTCGAAPGEKCELSTGVTADWLQQIEPNRTTTLGFGIGQSPISRLSPAGPNQTLAIRHVMRANKAILEDAQETAEESWTVYFDLEDSGSYVLQHGELFREEPGGTYTPVANIRKWSRNRKPSDYEGCSGAVAESRTRLAMTGRLQHPVILNTIFHQTVRFPRLETLPRVQEIILPRVSTN